jgi:hypothetical protein
MIDGAFLSALSRDSVMQKFVLLVYNEPALLDALPPGKADGMMRDCLAHADELALEGRLLGFQQLEGPETARSVRIRNGRVTAMDGPFAEAKEVLGGFNLIEAEDIEEATRMAAELPWATTGCIEVRPVRDIGAVRRRVGAPEAPAHARV